MYYKIKKYLIFSLFSCFMINLSVPCFLHAMESEDTHIAKNTDKSKKIVGKKKEGLLEAFNNLSALEKVSLVAGAVCLTGLALVTIAYRHKLPFFNKKNEQLPFGGNHHNGDDDKSNKDPLSNDHYYNFNDWDTACAQLQPKKTFITLNMINNHLTAFLESIKQKLKAGHWIIRKEKKENVTEINKNDKMPENFYVDTDEQFHAYVQKVILPNDAIVSLHGDIHSDDESLNKCLKKWAELGYVDKNDPFKIINPKFYVFFLGDYTDRGNYSAPYRRNGLEVIIGLLKFKSRNPDQVFMARGNHESVTINENHGFAQELQDKFNLDHNGSAALNKNIARIYKYLPVALYVGTSDGKKVNYAQGSHGGIEIGFDPNPILAEQSHSISYMRVSELKRLDGFLNLVKSIKSNCVQKNQSAPHSLDEGENGYCKDEIITENNGFMWSDFVVDPNYGYGPSGRNVAYKFGKVPTELLLKSCSGDTHELKLYFRAHQHGDHDMRARISNADKMGHDDDIGCGKLWIEDKPIHKTTAGLLNGVKVCTFTVSPGAGYNLTDDAFGILKMSKNYDDWLLEIHRMP